MTASRGMLRIILATSACLNAACGPSLTEVPLRSRFNISGILKMNEQQSLALTSELPRFSIVGASGERRVLSSAETSFEPATGYFSFAVTKKDFYPQIGSSPAELLAGLGQLNPLTYLPSNGFRESEMGYLRFELFSPTELADAGIVPIYAQKWVGLPVMSRFRDSGSISASSDVIVAQRVGLVKTKVVDAQSKPIANALLTIVPLASTANQEGDAQLLDFTAEKTFTPVAAYSDNQGRALLWPAPVDESGKKQFQVIASAPGFCAAATKPSSAKVFSAEAVLEMQSCSEEQKNARDPAWDASLLTATYKLETSTASLPSGTFLTNAESVEFAFQPRSSVQRGVVASIFEGTKAEGTLLSQQFFKVYSPRINVALPSLFKGRTSTRGIFVVQLESLLSEKDMEKGMIPARAIFTFEKVVRNPSAVFASRFQLFSLTGVENVIAADAAGQFRVKYLDCIAGQKIAVALSEIGISEPQLVWHTCKPEGNLVSIASLGAALNGQGGFKTVQFFIKDRYDNISRDDPLNTLNWRGNIWFDFGKPDPASLNLGAEVDIVPAGTVLPISSDQSLVELKPSNVAQHVFAFRQGVCSTVVGQNSAADGVDSVLLRGQKISKIYLGEVKQPLEMLESAVNCEGGGFPLSSSDVNFPELSSSDPATLSVTIFDLAGQQVTKTFSFPRCTGISPSPFENVCWSP